MDQTNSNTKDQSLLSRLMVNPLLRIGMAGFLAVIITLLLFLIMKYLITDYYESTSGAFYKLFTLNTVILTDDSQSRVRPQRPGYTEKLPIITVFSDEEIKQEATEFLTDQTIEKPVLDKPELPKPSVREELLKNREKLISILEE